MQAQRHAFTLSVLAAVGLLALQMTAAQAYEVPPFKGNDTGGIIAWPLAKQINPRLLAADHCAQYGKVQRRLATQRTYGGYVSFACVWPRRVRTVHVHRY
ncbi:hypothetical protein [Afipia sp. P52-10]|uniref:hypothetical protein n=1 Tax=Afipia sp. P52-10 TaxID=1429916 RepID=UPI0004B55F8A